MWRAGAWWTPATSCELADNLGTGAGREVLTSDCYRRILLFFFFFIFGKENPTHAEKINVKANKRRDVVENMFLRFLFVADFLFQGTSKRAGIGCCMVYARCCTSRSCSTACLPSFLPLSCCSVWLRITGAEHFVRVGRSSGDRGGT